MWLCALLGLLLAATVAEAIWISRQLDQVTTELDLAIASHKKNPLFGRAAPKALRTVNVTVVVPGSIWLVPSWLSSAELQFLQTIYLPRIRHYNLPLLVRLWAGRSVMEYSENLDWKLHDVLYAILRSPEQLFTRDILGFLQDEDNLDGAFQLIRYGAGNSFSPHFDAVEPSGESPSVVTCLTSLYSEDLSGGRTRFPNVRAGPDDEPVSIALEEGDLLCWKNVDELSATTNMARRESLHEGEPVLTGQKSIMTYWIQEELIPEGMWGGLTAKVGKVNRKLVL